MVSRRTFLAGALGAASGAAALGGGGAAHAASLFGSRNIAQPPPLSDFFRRPLVGDAALSPMGSRVALLGQAAPAPGAPLEAFIQCFDAGAPEAPPHRIPLPDLEAVSIDWASEDRLLLWVIASKQLARPPKAAAEDATYRRVIAINPDGSDPVILFENSAGSRAANLNLTRIVDGLADEPDHILMTAWDPEFQVAALYKVDVRNGRADLLERGGASTVNWRCQGGEAVLRYDMDREGRVVSLMTRSPGDSKWRLLRRIHRDETKDFQVVGSTPQPGVVLVAARGHGEDANSVRTLDTRTMSLGPALSARPSRDVANVLTNARDRFVAAAYYEDRLVYDFVNPRMAKHYKALNRFFGDENNVQLFDVDESQTRWLARVSGPREPGAYVLFDTERKRPVILGRVRPWLKPDSLAPMEAMDVRTRDGETIRAYVTLPVGSRDRPAPLVVLPHGGPELRDHISYDPWAQALAAQGWMVLQPNFRGSGGYGRAFAAAGWKRWGDRMQEDVEDAVDQLIRQRKVDAARVAIFGASYGGYSALMGAVRRPQFYKAVVAAAAPTDLAEMLRFEKKRQKGDPTVYEFWRARMGDLSKDAAILASASPRLRAREIQAPVMLVHGGRDDVVPVAQSRIMAQALKSAGKPCTVYEMKEQGHTDWGLDAERDVMQRVIAFLRPALA
jgi:dipeptidyl aminopeptidase/acylaminoacyl peptidase